LRRDGDAGGAAPAARQHRHDRGRDDGRSPGPAVRLPRGPLRRALLTALGYGYVAFQHDALWQLYAGSIARGIGLGFAYAAVATLVVAAVPPSETGVATGVNTLIRTVGASLGPQISAVILVMVPGEG